MSYDSKQELLRKVRPRRYLARDFDELKSTLLSDARAFYADQIQDFSEASAEGMLMDFAATVGDVMSYYLDHQFGELFIDTAVEDVNIERAIRDAGVEITGAAPAIVYVTFLVEVPAKQNGSSYAPDTSCLPIIEMNTVLTANNGTRFTLTEDINFAASSAGKLKATVKLGSVSSSNIPLTYILSRKGLCVSGEIATETFTIPSTFKAFRKLTLAKTNVADVVSVSDSLGNKYYEVTALTQDTVFAKTPNLGSDSDLVDDVLELLPAPYRFVRTMNHSTKLTTLTFGGGDATSLNDDIIPDPSEFAVPLYGKATFARFSIDPCKLLQTRTLGVATTNTTLSIIYRHGGGLKHNVAKGAIQTIRTLNMRFPNSPTSANATKIRATTEVTNEQPASGGDDAPTLDDLKMMVPAARNSQQRIVSREDLLARAYTMPSNFGRVFRIGVSPNPHNPLAAQLFVICRNSANELVIAPDMYKKNLARYLNKFRMISDAIDILDARVINIAFMYNVVIDSAMNKRSVLNEVNKKLKSFFDIKNFQIDQPLILDDAKNIIYNTNGVVSIHTITVENRMGSYKDRSYSGLSYDVVSNVVKGMLVPPTGGIFEIRYLDYDIVGSAV